MRHRLSDAADDGVEGHAGTVTMGRVIQAGLSYFALTFGAGFVLGPIRILVLEPRIGSRAAELLEMPVMIGVTFLAARWVAGRLDVPPRPGPRIGMGMLAAALLLAAEFGLVLRLRGLTLEEYFANRDPVSGTVYYAAVLLLALMPLLVIRRRATASRSAGARRRP